MRSFLNDRRHQPSSLRSRMPSSAMEAAFEMAVASATPSTDMRSTSTKNRLSSTLITPVDARIYSEVRVSPLARRMAISKFVSARNGAPAK